MRKCFAIDIVNLKVIWKATKSHTKLNTKHQKSIVTLENYDRKFVKNNGNRQQNDTKKKIITFMSKS